MWVPLNWCCINQSYWPADLFMASCGLLGDSNENKPLVGAEEEEVAKMGCPSLGEHTQVEVVIEESYEFKVSVFVLIVYLHFINRNVFVCMHVSVILPHFPLNVVHEVFQNTSAAHQYKYYRVN